MAYQDPYTEQSRPKQTRFSEELNPYGTSQPYQAYYPGAGPSYGNYEEYKDDPQHDYDNGFPRRPSGPNDNDYLGGSPPRKSGTARALRNYRYDHHGGLWTKGGRGRSIGRICCCTLMITALLFISIVLALALWIRPPNIIVGDVETIQENGSAIQLVPNGISVNLGVNISVTNPNYFAVDFKQIEAQIFYPINQTEIGSGVAHNVHFRPHSLTNWTFPFAINYTTTLDPNRLILVDLAEKCGVTGQKSNLSVSYKIKLGLRILSITISPVIKSTLSFACPIDASDLKTLMSSIGMNL